LVILLPGHEQGTQESQGPWPVVSRSAVLLTLQLLTSTKSTRTRNLIGLGLAGLSRGSWSLEGAQAGRAHDNDSNRTNNNQRYDSPCHDQHNIHKQCHSALAWINCPVQ
jgi:hypothetical protein